MAQIRSIRRRRASETCSILSALKTPLGGGVWWGLTVSAFSLPVGFQGQRSDNLREAV
jgi:hypothetical protein